MRIKESGGKLVAHARRPKVGTPTGYEYTSVNVFGNDDGQSQISLMLDNFEGYDIHE